MRTKHEIKMQWKPSGGLIAYDLTIPKGTRVVPADTHGKFFENGRAYKGQYFVDDLDWIPGRGNGLLLHDATHYGIRLNADQVE